MLVRIINHILCILLAILAPTVLIGCEKDSNDEPDTPLRDKVVYLTLNINTADGFGTSFHTRAGNYYYEEPERDNEKMNNLRIYIVQEDGTLEAMRYVVFNNPSVEMPDNITFRLTPGKKTVYLFANDTSLPQKIQDIFKKLENDIGAVFPASELSSAILQRDAESTFFTVDEDIPMCESFDVDLKSDDSGATYVKADVFVTRIAVKYTFICREPAEKVTVRLNGMSTSQYLMPNQAVYYPGKYEAAEVINGISGRNITSFIAPQNPGLVNFEQTLTGREEIEITDDTGKKSKAYRYDPIYLMETPGTSFSMSIRFDDGNETGTWFPEHELPNLPLLPRNTHVMIYMGVDEYTLNCKVDVVPYRGCILDPYFGLERQ